MVKLCWWYDDERYSAIVDRDSLRYLYELMTSSGGVKDDYSHIWCVCNDQKYEVQDMLAMMDHWT